MQFLTDFDKFEPWSGAQDTMERIETANKKDELESHLEDVFADRTPTATEINDYLRFQSDDVYRALGMKPDDTEVKTLDEFASEAVSMSPFAESAKEVKIDTDGCVLVTFVSEDGEESEEAFDEDMIVSDVFTDYEHAEIHPDTNTIELW